MYGRLSVACFVMFQKKLKKYAAKNKDTKAEEYTQSTQIHKAAEHLIPLASCAKSNSLCNSVEQ